MDRIALVHRALTASMLAEASGHEATARALIDIAVAHQLDAVDLQTAPRELERRIAELVAPHAGLTPA